MVCLGAAGQSASCLHLGCGVKLSVNLLEIDLNNIDLSSSGKRVWCSSSRDLTVLRLRVYVRGLGFAYSERLQRRKFSCLNDVYYH